MSRPDGLSSGHPAAEVVCDHCGLPVPAGLIREGEAEQFCCAGCRLVYETIRGCGLQRFYDLREPDAPRLPARTTGSDYTAFDDEAFTEHYVRELDTGRRQTDLYLEGVHCAACVWLVERLPRVLDGVVEARLDIGRRTARLTWNPREVSVSRIAATLDSLGYSPHAYRSGDMDEVRRREDRRHLMRIGVSGAIAGNVMLFAFALYGGMFGGIEPRHVSLFRWCSFALTLLILVWPGRVFFVGALSSIRTRMMHMDLPVALALGLGTAWGGWNTLRGAGEVYFESLAAVTFLLLVGRWIQHRQQRSAQDAVELLFSMTPSTARRFEGDGMVRSVPVEALRPGDRVELRAGDTVPADGKIVEGRSEFDLSMLTGESRPVGLGASDRVHAGTVNLTRPAVVEVEATGAATRVGRLMAMVEGFSSERPPLVRLADRVAHYFVIAVLALAAATVGLWLWIDPSRALENAIALLIVTCPCALGLATPLALVAAIGRAARADILIKGGEVVERLARAGTMLLDKTGTVTQGRTELVFWQGHDEVKPLVVAVERHVAHPIAHAFVEAFGGDGAEDHAADTTQSLGNGVRGRVEGRSVVIGSPRFVTGLAGPIPDWATGAAVRCSSRALSPVMLAVDGRVRGVAGFGDPVQEDASEAVAELRRLGWRVGLLSGDDPAVVDAVGEAIGIEAAAREGGATPERKATVVQETRGAAGTVAMVGDGVNDAAALAAASVGIAAHGGAEASLVAADVFLRRPGLDPLVELVRGSKRTVAVIRRNILVSLFYNVVTGGLAIAGVINPMIAAILMPLSSLTVVTLSYRSRSFDKPRRR